MAERTEPAVRVDHEALVAALIKMSPFSSQGIEADRERSLHPAHTFHQIGPRRGDRQMVVIRHQAPGVDEPAGARAGFAETFQKGVLGPLRAEDVRPVVAAVEHVINTCL